MDVYRGSTVLNIDAKVYAMLLCRLHVDMEERMHDAKHGFRSGRGTASTWTWRSGCMMQNTASVAAGAPQTASST